MIKGETRFWQEGRRWLWPLLALALVALVFELGLAYHLRYRWLAPPALYQLAQTSSVERSAVLYAELAGRLPVIEEYCRLWSAQAAMPGIEAVAGLQTVIDYRPHSPAARQAHVTLARHYVDTGSPMAEESYRAALALADDVALRLELARYLEEREQRSAAYDEYRVLLRDRDDAFAGMRRNGSDPLAVAADLIAATWYSDALETLRGVDDDQALPLRARALAALGDDAAAEQLYRRWLAQNPEDDAGRMGLAGALAGQGQVDAALAAYRAVDTADSRQAQADLLAESQPEEAIRLYADTPYPVAWWSASTLLESQGKLTDTLPVYLQVAESDSYLADDAAFRLHVLAKRLGQQQVYSRSQQLLAGQGLNWLGLRAGAGAAALQFSAPAEASSEDILAKAGALEAVGRCDLALAEIVLAAELRQGVADKLALAQALADRGEVVQAQAIARAYVDEHPRAPLALWQLSYPRPYSDTVQAAAGKYGLDPWLLWAIMRQESLFDPQAISYAGARGLMQLMPATQDWVAGELGRTLAPGDAFLPEENLQLAAWLLRWLLDYYDGDVDLALAGYNGGAASVDIWLADARVSNRDDLLRWIGYGETREYLERVGASYWVYQQLYGP